MPPLKKQADSNQVLDKKKLLHDLFMTQFFSKTDRVFALAFLEIWKVFYLKVMTGARGIKSENVWHDVSLIFLTAPETHPRPPNPELRESVPTKPCQEQKNSPRNP